LPRTHLLPTAEEIDEPGAGGAPPIGPFPPPGTTDPGGGWRAKAMNWLTGAVSFGEDSSSGADAAARVRRAKAPRAAGRCAAAAAAARAGIDARSGTPVSPPWGGRFPRPPLIARRTKGTARIVRGKRAKEKKRKKSRKKKVKRKNEKEKKYQNSTAIHLS
jgi:hypothetical protein